MRGRRIARCIRYTKAVYLALTDAAAGSDGYADSRIFTVAKYTAAINAAQQSGDIRRLVENSSDGTGTTFTWSRFSKAGEVGTLPDGTGQPAPGMGYANVDNLVFDVRANLWGVTDMTTGSHNGVGDGPTPTALPVDSQWRRFGGSAGGNLVGVFGNNWMFFIPTFGPLRRDALPVRDRSDALRDDRADVHRQHTRAVGAASGRGQSDPSGARRQPDVHTHDRHSQARRQRPRSPRSRTVPVGSQWPGNIAKDPTDIARPAVIGIQRKQRSWREHWEDDDG